MIVFHLVSKWLTVEELIKLEKTCKNIKYDYSIWRYHFFGLRNIQTIKYKMLSSKSIRETLISYHYWKKFISLPILHIIEYLYDIRKIRDFLLTCYIYNHDIILQLYKVLKNIDTNKRNHYEKTQISRWRMNIIIYLSKKKFRRRKKLYNKASVFKRTLTHKKLYVVEDKMFNKRIECFS